MPARLWIMLLVLCAAIGGGSIFALTIGVNEIRLIRSGPLRALLAEEVKAGTEGWVQVLGCARHDLEVAISPEGIVVAGERDARDRIYFAVTPQSECDDDAQPGALHPTLIVESRDAVQGLSRLYEKGYVPPPTRVVLDGVIGFGGGDGWRETLARAELTKRHPALASVPILVKGQRPGSKPAAYATAAVGLHGLLLISILAWLGIRRLTRGGMPKELLAIAQQPDEDDR